MYTIDEQLMMALRSYLSTVMTVCSTIVVISAVTPVFTVCLVPIIIYYAYQQNFFTVRARSLSEYRVVEFSTFLYLSLLQMTYRELKRLDSVNRSPIYALLGETIDGVATIRAYAAEPSLVGRLTRMLDLQQVRTSGGGSLLL